MSRYGMLRLVWSLSVLASVAAADDRAAALAIVERAITAHGGDAALAQHPVLTVRSQGIFHGYQEKPVYFFAAEETRDGSDQVHSRVTGKLRGEQFEVVNVLNGREGWLKLAGAGKLDVQPYSPDRLCESQERAYRVWLTTLLPLRSAELTLAVTPEELVRDRPAVGVRVTRANRRTVMLYFDRESGLLVKTSTRSKELIGEEHTVETLYLNYQTVQGLARPMMTMSYHDGQCLVSAWIDEYRPAATASARIFAKP